MAKRLEKFSKGREDLVTDTRKNCKEKQKNNERKAKNRKVNHEKRRLGQ